MSKGDLEGRIEDFVGNQHVVDFLRLSFGQESLAPAYLFEGPARVGKYRLAKRLAQLMLCQSPGAGSLQACGTCSGCQQFLASVHPDFYELRRLIDDKTGLSAQRIGIDQIRQLQERLHLHSFLNGHKLAIIDEVEHLSIEAANALLKIVEEPPARTILLLVCADSGRLPGTLQSRCQRLLFRLVPRTEIAEFLQWHEVKPAAAQRLAATVYGRPGLALELAQLTHGFDEQQQRYRSVLQLCGQTLYQRLRRVDELLKDFSPEQLCSQLTRVFRDLLLTWTGNQERLGNPSLTVELAVQAQKLSPRQLSSVLRELGQVRGQLSANVNPKLLFENIMLTF